MSTNFHFICHTCEETICIGKFEEARDIYLSLVISHLHHDINMAEDSDDIDVVTKGYKNICNNEIDIYLKELHSRQSPFTRVLYTPRTTFMEFYNTHRIMR
jgi:hypothetical protein